MRSLLIATLLSACASTAPIHATLRLRGLQDPPPVEQAGVGLALKPITYANQRQVAGLHAHIAWMEVDNNAPVKIGA